MKPVIPRILLAVYACAACIPTATQAQGAPQVIEIHAKRFSFTPAEITLTRGEAVTLAITAEDATHGLSIPELNVNATLNKGKTTKVEVTPSQAGTFNGQCNHFCGVGHGSMLFKVTVKDK